MRALDPELQARLDAGATTFCRCWRIDRQDGTALGFTDHDGDITFGGLTYEARSGLDAGAVERSTGLSVDNTEVVGALSSIGLTEADILAGRYDRAGVTLWLVDWDRPDLRVDLFKGSLGEIRNAGGAFEAELRGLAEALNQPVGRAYLRTCECALGDGKCGVDLGAETLSAELSIADVPIGASLTLTGLDGFAPGWFERGTLTWLSGANVGTTSMIRADRQDGAVRVIDLWDEAPQRIMEGDVLRLSAGCDKRAVTCREKFGNFLNFRGFPHIPGEDWISTYPKGGSDHNGASLFSTINGGN